MHKKFDTPMYRELDKLLDARLLIALEEEITERCVKAAARAKECGECPHRAAGAEKDRLMSEPHWTKMFDRHYKTLTGGEAGIKLAAEAQALADKKERDAESESVRAAVRAKRAARRKQRGLPPRAKR